MKAIWGRTMNIVKKANMIVSLGFLDAVIPYRNKHVAINDIESLPNPADQKLIEGINKINTHNLPMFGKNLFIDKYK